MDFRSVPKVASDHSRNLLGSIVIEVPWNYFVDQVALCTRFYSNILLLRLIYITCTLLDMHTHGLGPACTVTPHGKLLSIHNVSS